MSVLLDTSFVIALRNQRDEHHARAAALFKELLEHRHGHMHATNLVFSETVTTAFARTRRHSSAVAAGEVFLLQHGGRPLVRMHHLTGPQLLSAWDEFRRYRDKKLSMVDWTSVVVARELEVDHVLSFDEEFDGILPRLS